MKRRRFLLGVGALLTGSTAASSSAATLADSTTPVADFRVIDGQPSYTTDLTVSPNQKNKKATHEWYSENAAFDGEIDRFYVSYPSKTKLNRLKDRDVTVEITRDGESTPTNIPATISTNNSDATIFLDDGYETTVDGEVRTTLDGVGNPQAGTYYPEMTWLGNQEDASRTEEMVIVS